MTEMEKSEDHSDPPTEEECVVKNETSADEPAKNNSTNDTDINLKKDPAIEEILDFVKQSSAVFQSQQIGDPELSATDKRKIAEDLFNKNPVQFLLRFGEYLEEEHLNYFLTNFSSSYEVQYYVKHFKNLLNDHTKKIIKRNRRYEAMKKLEAESNYFSETEMEKREPLLYHQMVGQFLNEKEKMLKFREAQKHVIPSFSSFLITKFEREEMNSLIKTQQEEENRLEQADTSSEEETSHQEKRWGEDWEEEKSRKKIKKMKPKMQNISISSKEKNLLLHEFKSIMKSNFMNGKDVDFNYSEVDFNPDYDSVEIRSQDEEEKYFNEETCDTTICTDTGIEDY